MSRSTAVLSRWRRCTGGKCQVLGVTEGVVVGQDCGEGGGGGISCLRCFVVVAIMAVLTLVMVPYVIW